MRAVYLSSVRSPALGRGCRTVPREFSPSAVFSQIPEQDTTYAEDSFCVGDEEEEEEAESGCSEEEMCVSFDLLSSSRGRYLTRRARRLQQARLGGSTPSPLQKRKPSRIVVLSDSSEEEPLEAPAGQEKGQLPRALPSAPSAQHRSGAGAPTAPQDTQRLLGLETSESGLLDVPPEHPSRSTDLQAAGEVSAQGGLGASLWGAIPVPGLPSLAGISRVPGDHSPSLCILADSREISSGPQVISCLRAVHGLRVQVCSLGTSDYIVSNRLAVDRVFQSELQSPGNRNKLSQRLQRLQGVFERICVVVETDRVRPGVTSRSSQRTQYYDGVLAALVQAGIRILFSSCQEQTAALLKELALLEHRKDAAIQVPTEPEGHRRDLLSFYLSIPNLSYGAALNLCHSFGSITAVANSSGAALAAGARLSRPQAEQLHRFLCHDFDPQLLPQPLPAKDKS
ncbi:FANCM protein, partial [Polioptila caerulea]|nr:FANCM protein [Polioptila caerulea]